MSPKLYRMSKSSFCLIFCSFITFFVMSMMTAFVHWLCPLYTPGSITAISSWSGFRHIYSGNSSPFPTLQLVWCSVYVATTMSQTPLQFCTGCVLPQRVDFKVAVMAFRVLHGLAPVSYTHLTLPTIYSV